MTEESLLRKRAFLLSWFTVLYNLAEGAVSVAAGRLAGSSALVGFGADSFIESLSGMVMIWRFRKGESLSREEEERVEQKAVRLAGVSFFVFAAYVIFESVKSLVSREEPEKSLLGIIIAIVSLIVMPLLFIAKYRLGEKIKSRSLVADSKETLACILLSAALLVGLGLNYLFGWWQADSVAGIVIALFLIKEGYQTLKNKELCEC